jgi:hypothetical protein
MSCVYLQNDRRIRLAVSAMFNDLSRDSPFEKVFRKFDSKVHFRRIILCVVGRRNARFELQLISVG